MNQKEMPEAIGEKVVALILAQMLKEGYDPLHRAISAYIADHGGLHDFATN